MSSKRPRFSTNLLRYSKGGGSSAYRRRGALLSPGELRFYRALVGAVGGRYVVMAKVRLTDVVEATEGFNSPAGRKISQRHIDFVLVTPKRLSVVAVIELDDNSHLVGHQQKRDAYLADALGGAGVPLLRVPIYKRYDAGRLRQTLLGSLARFRVCGKRQEPR